MLMLAFICFGVYSGSISGRFCQVKAGDDWQRIGGGEAGGPNCHCECLDPPVTSVVVEMLFSLRSSSVLISVLYVVKLR